MTARGYSHARHSKAVSAQAVKVTVTATLASAARSLASDVVLATTLPWHQLTRQRRHLVVGCLRQMANPGTLLLSAERIDSKIPVMSPKILEQGELIFWFHSHNVLHEKRTSIHVGKGSQDDYNDAKIWLEPEIEVGRIGRTLRQRDLNRALEVIRENLDYLLEQWHDYQARIS
jgi:hypothetical protein